MENKEWVEEICAKNNEIYNQLSIDIKDEKKRYKIIDKLSYDNWNEKEVIRKYITNLEEENKHLESKLNKTKEWLQIEIDNSFSEYYPSQRKKVLTEVMHILEGNEDK